MTEFIDIDGMVDGEFGDWHVAIAVFNDQLVVQYKRVDDEPVGAWGPSYEATGKRGTISVETIRTRSIWRTAISCRWYISGAMKYFAAWRTLWRSPIIMVVAAAVWPITIPCLR